MLNYTRLHPRHVRFLVMDGAHGLDDPIHCRLVVTGLDADPNFSALSYVWGNPSLTDEIDVDGEAVAIGANLSAALRHIRKKYGQTVLWVDAVCINQSDTEERDQQILLMGEIYSKASKVIGWLGPAADNSRLAMDVLRRIPDAHFKHILKMGDSARWDDMAAATAVSHHWKNFGWISMVPQLHAKPYYGGSILSIGSAVKRGDGRHLAWMLSPKFGTMSPAWVALDHLFRRDYWMRIWIVQEIVLARKYILMCGLDVLEDNATDALSHLLGALRACEQGLKPGKMDVVAFSKLGTNNSWKSAQMTLETLNRSDAERSLKELVGRFRFHQAQDPKDRIYGLLGLSVDKIMPSSASTVDEVYREFARIWVAEFKDASILVYAELDGFGDRETSRVRHTLPTWVPNWESATATRSQYSRNTLGESADSQQAFRDYNASQSRTFSWHVLADNLKLSARGIRVGVISYLGTKLSPFSFGEYKDFFLQNNNLEISNYPSGSSMAEALFRLFFLDKDIFTQARLETESLSYAKQAFAFAYGVLCRPNEEQRTEKELAPLSAVALTLAMELSADYFAAAEHGVIMSTILTRSLMGLPLADDSNATLLKTEMERLQLQLLQSIETTLLAAVRLRGFQGWVNGRRIFRLDNGYFGIGPSDSKVGDLVVILDGSNMPAVLRKNKQHFSYLGLSYVQGLMDGEALAQLDKGALKEQTFILC